MALPPELAKTVQEQLRLGLRALTEAEALLKDMERAGIATEAHRKDLADRRAELFRIQQVFGPA